MPDTFARAHAHTRTHEQKHTLHTHQINHMHTHEDKEMYYLTRIHVWVHARCQHGTHI